jgi:tetratricopeptide (TPR) repeat protein
MNDPLESRVADILDEFTQRLNQGESPAIEDYLERCPEAARLLRDVLPTLAVLRGLDGGDDADAHDDAQTALRLQGALGDFRIVREVGRGGMGVVYEAQQISLARRVALKILPFAAVVDPRQVARFKKEAQAAGQLDHPHIVDVIAIGVERGVHYYAMRFVDGMTLAQIVNDLRDEKREPHSTSPWAALSTSRLTNRRCYFRSIAQLAIPVAEALDHAHEVGVIHRDVKPSNLMVDGRGKVWITDFGLARINSAPEMTFTGDLVGTLRYMSPEQALAKRAIIDHRTDVYSLGATLYELLTLQPVFAGHDKQELLKQIAFEEPRPLRKLDGAVPGDLETIVLKALEKNPSDRYASARELADDLRRFVDDKPIRARPPGLNLRAVKWGRRHRGAVAVMIVAAALTGAAGPIVAWRENSLRGLAETRRQDAELAAQNERQQRAIADEQRKQAEAAAKLLEKVFAQLGPSDAHQDLKAQIVARLETVAADLDKEFADEPHIRASLLGSLGQSLRGLEEWAKAAELFRKAFEIERAHCEADDPRLLQAMKWLAVASIEVGASREAVPLFEQALKMDLARYGRGHAEMIETMHNLANAYLGIGDVAHAAALNEEALELARANLGADDKRTLIMMRMLAEKWSKIGRHDRAIPLGEEVLAREVATLGPDDPQTLGTLSRLGGIYDEAGRPEKAQPLLEKALMQIERNTGPDSRWTLMTADDLDHSYFGNGQYAKAVELLRHTLSTRKAKFGPEHRDTLVNMNNLALAYAEVGDGAAALRLFEEALKLQMIALGPHDPDTLTTMHNLALQYQAGGQLDEAISLFEKMLDVRKTKLGREHPETLFTTHLLARAYEQAAEPERALPLYQETLEWQRNALGPDHPLLAGTLASLALNLLLQEKFIEAEPIARECLAIRDKDEPDAWTTFNTRSMLGGSLLGQGNYAQAEPLLVAGYEGLIEREAQIPPLGKVRLTEALERLVKLYESWHKPDEAANWREKLKSTL